MSELFIGGEWQESASGRRADVINPVDQSLIGTVSDGDTEDAASRDPGGAHRVRRGRVAAHATGRTRRAAQPSRGPADQGQGGDRAQRNPGHRQTVGGKRNRRRRRRLGLPLLRRPRREPGLPAGRRWSRGDQPDRLRAGRRVRVDHAVELPAVAGQLEGRARAGRGQHDRRQTERDHPARPPSNSSSCSKKQVCPSGVANLVLGLGPNVGAPLVESPAVDLVSFTGSLRTGQWIMSRAAETMKKVCLELGGKNPNIVFADADLDVALDYALTAVFLHAGQVCSAGTRLLLQDEIYEDFVTELAAQGREDQARQRIRPGQRERATGLRAASVQSGALRQARRRGGRAAADRRCETDRSRAGQGLVLPADRVRGLHA